jgi:ribonuclease HI
MAFYAVAKGAQTGIFKTWAECANHTQGYSGAVYKKFDTKEAAERFIKEKTHSVSTVVAVLSIPKEQPKPQIAEKNAFSVLMNIKQKVIETKDGYYMIKGTAPTEKPHLLQFDGGAEPNPGRAAGGAILFSPDGQPLFERAEFIPHATNNEAEYTGLLVGLQEAAALGVRALEIQGDSNLVVQQVAGKWKISAANLKGFHAQVIAALVAFEYVAIRHIYRDQNTDADRIATEGITDGESFIRN